MHWPAFSGAISPSPPQSCPPQKHSIPDYHTDPPKTTGQQFLYPFRCPSSPMLFLAYGHISWSLVRHHNLPRLDLFRYDGYSRTLDSIAPLPLPPLMPFVFIPAHRSCTTAAIYRYGNGSRRFLLSLDPLNWVDDHHQCHDRSLSPFPPLYFNDISVLCCLMNVIIVIEVVSLPLSHASMLPWMWRPNLP